MAEVGLAAESSEGLAELAEQAPGCRRTGASAARAQDELRWSRHRSERPVPIAEAHPALIVDKERNKQIADDVHASLAQGRNCLVLTRRVAHLETLTSLLAGRGHEPLVLQGGMPAKERRAIVERLTDARAGDAVLVVGTTPFVGEGFDAPALDILFLAAPVSFDGLLLQCAGRVVRPAPGKTVAEVHDYHDVLVPLLAASLQRRMPGYKRLRFERA